MPRAFSRARAIMLRIDCGLVRSNVRKPSTRLRSVLRMCRAKRLAAREDVQRDLDRRRAVVRPPRVGSVELEKEPDVEQPGDVFGTLEVAAHPEQVFGDPAQHLRSLATLVCRDPGRRAASGVVQDPGVLGAASLRAVDDQAPLGQRHARQARPA